MKKIKSLFFALCAAAFMVGCSDEIDPNSQNGQLKEGDGDGYYMGLDIQLPTGNMSRSQTDKNGGSTDGTEVGQDYENIVSNALIILAEPTSHKFIVAAEVASNNLTQSTTGASYKALAKMNASALNDYYDKLDNPQNFPSVEVFVFCNPTKWLVDKAVNWKPTEAQKTEWLDWDAIVIQGNPEKSDNNVGIWSPNSFLMNNENIVIRLIPKNVLDWENFDKAENAFHLSEANAVADKPDLVLPNNSVDMGRGPIKVERSVARFDFKDGSKIGHQTYNVLFQADPEDPENVDKNIPIVAVKLEKMCLVNMSNRFYFLPRVSNDGQNTNTAGNDWKLCGAEKMWGRVNGVYQDGNYVVGPYAADYSKIATNWGNTNPYDFFNFPFFDANGTFNNGVETKNQWDVYDIEKVLSNGTPDKYTGENSDKPNQTPGQYVIWRYVTENVIPDPESNQINGISTGIVFRGRLQGTEQALNGKLNEETWELDVYKNMARCLNGLDFELRREKKEKITGVTPDGISKDPILYYLDGKLYFTWEHLRQAAIQASVTPMDIDDATKTITSVEINRSNAIYRAVFGDGPIPATMKYVIDGKTGQANAYSFTDPRWNDDVNSAEYKLYAASCDYAWDQWMKGGQVVGTLTNDGIPAAKLVPIQNMRAAMTKAGIAIYQTSLDPNSTTPGYFCYYYYWNRHNDNGMAGIMGPMEFDVVRNNVYKLSVDKISRLGHPRIPENDPDKPKPETPDESSNIYLDVTVEIADWAVRINGINF